MQNTIDLYVKSIDLAKDEEGLTNQDKLILSKFRVLLRGDSVDKADKEIAQVGKINRETLHQIRELAEGHFEVIVRSNEMSDSERERIIAEGKKRADSAEAFLLNELMIRGIIYND